MKLIDRIVSRSGELCFDHGVDNIHRADEVRYHWIRSLLGDALTGRSIIDFGCWTGSTLRQMGTQSPGRVAGLDIEGPWTDVAREALPDAEIVDVENFTPLPETFRESFDYAFLLETLEHIPRGSEVETLTTIRESLRPGGQLVLSTPAAGIGAPLDPAWWLVGHRHYRKATLVKSLEAAGFSDVEIRYSGNVMTSIDTLQLYIRKHLFHKMHYASERIINVMDTGLVSRRGIGSHTIWAVARR